MSTERRKPLMRSLGEFFGHVWKGVSADVSRPARQAPTTPEPRETDTRPRVILRRTTVEEVELRPQEPGP